MEEHKTKATALRTIMRNPKLSRLVKDAWKAPFGSTKRQQAKSMISTISRLRQNQDSSGGQGGPGDYIKANNMGTNFDHILNATYNPFASHGHLPNSPIDTINTGKGGPNDSLPTGDTSNNSSPFQGVYDFMANPKLVSGQGVVPDTVNNLWNTYKNLSAGVNKGLVLAGTAPYAVAGLAQQAGSYIDRPEGQDVVSPAETWGGQQINKTVNTLYPAINKAFGQVNPTAGADSGISATPGATNQQPNPYTANQNNVFARAASATDIPYYTPPTATDNTLGSDTGMGPDPENMMQQIQDLAASSPNAATFQQKILANKSLSDYLFPGGTPNDQAIAMFKQVGDASGLTQYEAALNQALQSNGTIQQDLTDYVQNRDQYIDNINKEIDAIQSRQTSGADFDPTTVSADQNYVNFLLGLKAQQNQRYTDVINNAVTQQNAKVAALGNMVQVAASQFNTELPMTQAAAQDMTTQISDLYGSLTNAGNNLMSMSQTQLDAMAKKVKDIQDIQAYANSQTGQIDDQAKKIIDNDFIASKTAGSPTVDYKKLPTDLASKMQGWIADGYNPNSINAAIASGLDSTFANESGSSAMDSLYNVTNSFSSVISNGVPQQMANAGYTGDLKGDLMTNLMSRAKSAIGSYVKSNQPAVEQALIDLPADPRDSNAIMNWKKKESSLNTNFLDFLAGTYIKNRNAGQTKEDIFGLSKTGGFLGIGAHYNTTDEINNVSAAIASYLATQVGVADQPQT